MNTVRFISVWEKANLLADENKDSGGECQNSHNHRWNRDAGEEQSKPRENQVNCEQKHADVFGEVHALSILIVRTDYNLKTVAPLSLVCPSLLGAVTAVYDRGIFEFKSVTHINRCGNRSRASGPILSSE